MGEEGGENGAGFFAGAPFDIGGGPGLDGGKIGVPAFGVQAVEPEGIGIRLNDFEGGAGLGGGIGGEGVVQIRGNGAGCGFPDFGLGGLVQGGGLRSQGIAEGLKHGGEVGDFADVAHEDIGVAGGDEGLHFLKGLGAGQGAADFAEGVFREIGGEGGFLVGEGLQGGPVVLVGQGFELRGPGDGLAALGQAVEGGLTLGNEVGGETGQGAFGRVEVALVERLQGGLVLDALVDFGLGFLDGVGGTDERLLAFEFGEGVLEAADGDELIDLLLDFGAMGFLKALEEEGGLRKIGVEGDGVGEELGGLKVVLAVGDEAAGIVQEIGGLSILVTHFLKSGIGDGGQDGGGFLGGGFRGGVMGIPDEGEDQDEHHENPEGNAAGNEQAGAARGKIVGFDGDLEGNAADGEDILVLEGGAQNP